MAFLLAREGSRLELTTSGYARTLEIWKVHSDLQEAIVSHHSGFIDQCNEATIIASMLEVVKIPLNFVKIQSAK